MSQFCSLVYELFWTGLFGIVISVLKKGLSKELKISFKKASISKESLSGKEEGKLFKTSLMRTGHKIATWLFLYSFCIA